ncbi:MAG: hypothetical protein AB2693_08630, partial [Candidatus Thiodiazotropha sp.]
MKWFVTTTTTEMRYSDTFKAFWRVGLLLFKGKFIRFMSGPKHGRHLISGESERGVHDPIKSQIKFVVPSRDFITSSQKSAESIRPGVLTDTLDMIAKSYCGTGAPFKLCADLKKLNPGGKSGDVDIFSYENAPTLKVRQDRLASELAEVTKMQNAIEHEENGNGSTRLTKSPNSHFFIQCIWTILTVLAMRIRDLRDISLKRNLVFQKLKEQTEPNWASSKNAFVLSSIQTSLYQIDACIKDITGTSADLIRSAAVFNNTESHTTTNNGQPLDLNIQSNYVCLQGIEEEK